MERSVTSLETKYPTSWLRRQHTSPCASKYTGVRQTPGMSRHSTEDARTPTVSVPTARTSRQRGEARTPGRTQSRASSSSADRHLPSGTASPPQDRYFQDEVTQVFERERSRLMERPAATIHQRSHDSALWGDKIGSGLQQHMQYIRRLADLRDELLSQEQTGLARALDRLRLDSINNRDASRYRLKLKEPNKAVPGSDVSPGKTASCGSTPRPLMTTVEKFRQQRPKRQAPVILPLQGKQLIEPPLDTGTANVGTGGRQPAGGDDSAAKTDVASRLEETVRANLKRLIQPTSSIPNIGRKALRQESLELKTQSLQNMRSRVYRATRPFASPFITQLQGESSETSSRTGFDPEPQLSPHVYKLGALTDGDRLDMDKLRQYYYICCRPSSRSWPSSPETDPQNSAASTPGQDLAKDARRRQQLKRTSLERSPAARTHRKPARKGSLRESENQTLSVGRYKHAVNGVSSSAVTLPVITSHRGSLSSDAYPDGNLSGHATLNSSDGLPALERKRRQIVIDMPNIIFNAATPEVAPEARGDRALPGEGTGTLSKALKQNELRHREVYNLLEDVKELNKRTEVLNSQCTSETC